MQFWLSVRKVIGNVLSTCLYLRCIAQGHCIFLFFSYDYDKSLIKQLLNYLQHANDNNYVSLYLQFINFPDGAISI